MAQKVLQIYDRLKVSSEEKKIQFLLFFYNNLAKLNKSFHSKKKKRNE